METRVEHPIALAVVVAIALPLGLALLFAPLRMLRLIFRAGLNVNGVTPLDPAERREMRRVLEHEPSSFAGQYKRVIITLSFYTFVLLLIGGCGLLGILMPGG